jgi:SpoIID/LytB domain protein
MTRRRWSWLLLAESVSLLLATGVTAGLQRPRPAPAASEQARPTIEAPAEIRVGIAGAGGYKVQRMPIEQYVAGVLTGEAARESPPAVLQALAIAIRTYALRNVNRHIADGFDVCDETHCQVLRTGTAATIDASDRTSGRVLTWRGALAIVYYSASCGGHTERPSAVWPGAEDPPYLPARPDDGCGGDPVWSAQLAVRDIERALVASGFSGRLKAIRVLSRDSSGRVQRLAVDGLTPSSLSGQDLRMFVGPQLGWQLVKSTAFQLRRAGERYEFEGRGYGHGVGMCVIGATRLASRGESAEALLARYFPGTDIGSTASGRSPVPSPPPAPAATPVPTATAGTSPGRASGASANVPSVPDEQTRQRQELGALADKLRQELSRTMEVAAPAGVTLQLHASDVDYERATGRHWFTFGAFIDGTLHLTPVDPLRARGLLERVIRREMVHAIVDRELAQRPRWVRDGAALYYSDPQIHADVKGPCPSDIDLEQPVSAGALMQAYAGARACFARQIAAGRGWRDVR